MNPEAPVQRQLDAYNAKDLEYFVAQYTDDVQVFRPPETEAVISGKPALAEHYQKTASIYPICMQRCSGDLYLGTKSLITSELWVLAVR